MDTPPSITVAGIDLEQLLAAVSAERPTGISLEQEPGAPLTLLEDQLEACARQEDRTIRRQAALATVERARQLLRKSKDLVVAAFMMRALLIAHGFPGLFVGLQLIHELHKRYWQDLQPGPLPDSTEPKKPKDREAELDVLLARRRPLLLIGEPLRSDAIRVAVTPPLDEREPEYSFYRWQVAADKDAVVSADRLQEAARRAPLSHFTQLHEVLESCRAECSEISRLCKKLYERPASTDGEEAFEPPDLDGLRNTLAGCLELIERQIERAQQVKQPSTQAAAALPTSPAASTAPPLLQVPSEFTGAARYEVQSREQALACLTRAARFLHHYEPLSPVPYLVARAVRWGALTSLREWLDELCVELGGTPPQLLHELGMGLDKELGDTPAVSPVEERRAPLRGLLQRLGGEGRGSAIPRDDEAGAPTITTRAEALALVRDAAGFLYEQEPLSPLSHHLKRALTLSRSETPAAWLAELLPRGDAKTLDHFRKTLGLLPEKEREPT